MPSPLQLVGHVSEVVEVPLELVALIAQVLRRNPCVPRLPLDCTVRQHNFGTLPEEHFDQYAHPELLERGKMLKEPSVEYCRRSVTAFDQLPDPAGGGPIRQHYYGLLSL